MNHFIFISLSCAANLTRQKRLILMLQQKIFVCVHTSEYKSYWLILKWVFRAGAMITEQLHKLLLKSKLF